MEKRAMGSRTWIVSAESEPRIVIAALKNAPARNVHIIASPRTRSEARLLQQVVLEFASARVWVQHGELIDDTIATVSNILSEEQDVYVLAAGSQQAAMLSAAYMHGAPAYTVVDGIVRELPVLPYGYPEQLTDAKLAILEAVRHKPVPLADVLKVTKLKPSAASYHLHGTSKKPGLLSMRVVARDEKERLTLTPKGRALVRGVGKR